MHSGEGGSLVVSLRRGEEWSPLYMRQQQSSQRSGVVCSRLWPRDTAKGDVRDNISVSARPARLRNAFLARTYQDEAVGIEET